MRYSPLDALGLEYKEYNKGKCGKEVIIRAFRRASLHCHPDRRSTSSIPTNRWPTQRHLEESRDFLLNPGDDSLDKYRGYPKTFFPWEGGDAAYKAPEKSPFDVCTECGSVAPCSCASATRRLFSVCEKCRMPLPFDELESHKRLDHVECQSCGKLYDVGEHVCLEDPRKRCRICGILHPRLMEHIMEQHRLPTCGVCKGYSDRDGDVDGLVYHVQGHPICPLCPQSFPIDSELNRHINACHLYDLPSSDDILGDHSWVLCPFPECYRVQAGKLWHHVSVDHSFVRCPACPDTEAEFSVATEHITEHTSVQCPECLDDFTKAALEPHLVVEHGWTQCPYCIRAAVDDEDFEEHIGDHKLTDCQECSEKQPFANMQRHMLKVHGWLPCSFCAEPVQGDRIFEHMHGCKSREKLHVDDLETAKANLEQVKADKEAETLY